MVTFQPLGLGQTSSTESATNELYGKRLGGRFWPKATAGVEWRVAGIRPKAAAGLEWT